MDPIALISQGVCPVPLGQEFCYRNKGGPPSIQRWVADRKVKATSSLFSSVIQTLSK